MLLLFSSKYLSSLHFRWLMLPEMPKFPSLFSSISLASTLKPDPPLSAGARILSWLPAARVWWTCPSGAKQTERTGLLTERGSGGTENRQHTTARSLEISKSQTLKRITRGNHWVWAILPGDDGIQSISAKKLINFLLIYCLKGFCSTASYQFNSFFSTVCFINVSVNIFSLFTDANPDHPLCPFQEVSSVW